MLKDMHFPLGLTLPAPRSVRQTPMHRLPREQQIALLAARLTGREKQIAALETKFADGRIFHSQLDRNLVERYAKDLQITAQADGKTLSSFQAVDQAITRLETVKR